MPKSLDQKLVLLAKERFHKTFILADAKDADMALGIAAPGPARKVAPGGFPYRTLAEYREQIRRIIRQELVDIMLMSCSTNELLTIRERCFDRSPVTAAVRTNDSTDIHLCRGDRYSVSPSLPFASPTLDHIQTGKSPCSPWERSRGANLGLYSVTFNNIPERDRETLQAYKAFRLEAESRGFRHFLEVFDPNVPFSVHGVPEDQIGGFVNDHICRMLAGVPTSSRPLFLKIVYHGPRYMEELCRYDESLIVGILGGGSGTTYDAFKLLQEAKKYGARVALFGRKINHAEDQLAFVEMLRHVAEGELSAEEAVRAYHGRLQATGVAPQRSLADDLILTTTIMRYASSSVPIDGGRITRPDGAPGKSEDSTLKSPPAVSVPLAAAVKPAPVPGRTPTSPPVIRPAPGAPAAKRLLGSIPRHGQDEL